VRQALVEGERSTLKRASLEVPDTPDKDRLMRYESHLSREFDRLLSLLERLQRMPPGRLGPPAVRLELVD
jgi:hypothetical protein